MCLFRKKEKKEPIKVDCTGCIHLYYNNDGSTSCDSCFEKGCLISGVRMYKEFQKQEVH